MKVTKTDRGFEWIELPRYAEEDVISRLVSQSSLVGHYDDAFDRPGSSYLWIGEYHHLRREQVAEFVEHLQAWLKTGSLEK